MRVFIFSLAKNIIPKIKGQIKEKIHLYIISKKSGHNIFFYAKLFQRKERFMKIISKNSGHVNIFYARLFPKREYVYEIY